MYEDSIIASRKFRKLWERSTSLYCCSPCVSVHSVQCPIFVSPLLHVCVPTCLSAWLSLVALDVSPSGLSLSSCIGACPFLSVCLVTCLRSLGYPPEYNPASFLQFQSRRLFPFQERSVTITRPGVNTPDLRPVLVVVRPPLYVGLYIHCGSVRR